MVRNTTAHDARRASLYFGLACALTWLLAMPTASAWIRHEAPGQLAMACAGLSAFGPLLATLAVAARSELRDVFGRWRANPAWILLSLLAPAAIHLAATALFAVFEGAPERWFHPPVKPEAFAALLVFPIGEEFGWRGFAYPRLTRHFGLVRGNLILGTMWGLWHLAYSITPEKAGFDLLSLALMMIELPLYSLLMAWVLERTNRSMAVAIAFHAGAHLDHIEWARNAGVLHALHITVLAVVATFAARSLAKLDAARTSVSAIRISQEGGRAEGF